MESRLGDRGLDPVSSRVAQKLANSHIMTIPIRTRRGATRASLYSRKTADEVAVADIDEVTQHDAHHLADALSLSGTTPPSSPKATSFSKPDDMHDISTAKVDPSRHYLDPIAAARKTALTPDAAFRKHNRGIGSIDSILTSTTCVNTHSECSRADSRLSHCDYEKREVEPIAHHGSHLQVASERPSLLYPISPLTPRIRTSFASVEGDDEEEQEKDYDEELSHLVDELSSCVLRSTLGKDVEDCPAPLLVLDCTSRYLEEIRTAAETGSLVNTLAASDQSGSCSPGDSSQRWNNGSQDGASQRGGNGKGKGKRKAEGGSDDGFGDADGGSDRNGDPMTGLSPTGRPAGSFNYSCPYRKRNPLRFNVRDKNVCATHSFTDMSQLKKHIRAHHPPVQRSAGLFSCPRCCQGFPVKDDLDGHLRQAVMCSVADDQGGANPEDGITGKIITSLEARTVKAKIDNWDSLWKLLFPHDQEIPDPAFIPVMEIFDFAAESKKFLQQLQDLLDLQYRHVLDGAVRDADMEIKIRQGLERSTQSIYTWIETVVQDWEQRAAGISSAARFFNNLSANHSARVNNWVATTEALPPSPALTPTVPGSVADTGASTVLKVEPPELVAPMNPTITNQTAPGTQTARYRLPQKRAKRANNAATTQPATQIPVPSHASRAASLGRSFGSRLARPMLPSHPPPSQPAPPPPLQSAPSQETISQYQSTHWESIPVSSPYAMSYNSPTGFFPPTTGIDAGQYPTVTHSQVVQPFLPSEATVPTDFERRPSSSRISRIMSSTPRSSIASNWMRDENRDSSQTLVEPHGPGRCSVMFCPTCNKTLPDSMDMMHGHPTSEPPILKSSPIYHQHHEHNHLLKGGDVTLTSPDPAYEWSHFQHHHGLHYDATAGGGGHMYE
ncbi:hypothetical protein QBC37DRAFT_274665 [Rhypophila decipiens]|uniref:C2H2-type domain-containing protein n=1 Tax=Rhypophila decipiens TaxID=261697 RepID=A0AAN6YIZ9_9PEZI|nr:hypothetical protein QBC37DRAFT_274665 [Rhypophila decipiens]